MLKVEDLRVGNYVKGIAIDLTHKIDLHFFNEAYDDDTMLDWYSPIPLTEAILIACGFEESGEGFTHKEYNEFDIYLFLSENNLWSAYNLSKEGFMVMSNTFKSLHQLQNLFYCLSGKELNYTL